MMQRLVEFDIIYISYDEPNCEEHWADLLTKAPWAQRVHGVTGFDAAHKEAANIAKTDRFITVDGDNIIVADILEHEVELDNLDPNTVLSFSSRNNINGLIYGNGGLKLWPKEFVMNMKTHEVSEEEDSTVDFCWYANYKQFDRLSSHNYQNGSAFQAFRAGMREGVKMSLDRGLKVDPEIFIQTIQRENLQRLLIWCSVGTDMLYGDMAILGARIGAYQTLCTDWDFSLIRDYVWFNEYWEKREWDKQPDLLTKLREEVGLEIVDLNSEQSKFFKSTHTSPSRTRFE